MADLREELNDIRAQITHASHRAIVTEVEAKPSSYPGFHSRLEWDNEIAGPKYREVQVGEIIRTIKVSYVAESGETHKTRAFVSVARRDDPVEREYVPIEEVAVDPRLRELALRDARREWTALLKKYEYLEEFVGMIREDISELVN